MQNWSLKRHQITGFVIDTHGNSFVKIYVLPWFSLFGAYCVNFYLHVPETGSSKNAAKMQVGYLSNWNIFHFEFWKIAFERIKANIEMIIL